MLEHAAEFRLGRGALRQDLLELDAGLFQLGGSGGDARLQAAVFPSQGLLGHAQALVGGLQAGEGVAQAPPHDVEGLAHDLQFLEGGSRQGLAEVAGGQTPGRRA